MFVKAEGKSISEQTLRSEYTHLYRFLVSKPPFHLQSSIFIFFVLDGLLLEKNLFMFTWLFASLKSIHENGFRRHNSESPEQESLFLRSSSSLCTLSSLKGSMNSLSRIQGREHHSFVKKLSQARLSFHSCCWCCPVSWCTHILNHSQESHLTKRIPCHREQDLSRLLFDRSQSSYFSNTESHHHKTSSNELRGKREVSLPFCLKESSVF